jgi:hypothetical protein
MCVEDHLARRGLVVHGLVRVDREVPEEVHHRRDAAWVHPVLGFLHAEHVAGVRIELHDDQRQEPQGAIGESPRSQRLIHPLHGDRKRQVLPGFIAIDAQRLHLGNQGSEHVRGLGKRSPGRGLRRDEARERRGDVTASLVDVRCATERIRCTHDRGFEVEELPVTGLRTLCAAVWMSLSARARRNCSASKRFDFPTPLGPTKHVSGPNRTVTSRRFLKPWIPSRSSMMAARPS